MNFLNIEKNKILRIFFSIFQVFFAFHAIFNIKKNIEKCPFTYWLNGRWFLQIVERDKLESICIKYPLFPCSDFVSQMWGWFGGGGGWGCNVSHILCYFQHF